MCRSEMKCCLDHKVGMTDADYLEAWHQVVLPLAAEFPPHHPHDHPSHFHDHPSHFHPHPSHLHHPHHHFPHLHRSPARWAVVAAFWQSELLPYALPAIALLAYMLLAFVLLVLAYEELLTFGLLLVYELLKTSGCCCCCRCCCCCCCCCCCSHSHLAKEKVCFSKLSGFYKLATSRNADFSFVWLYYGRLWKFACIFYK